MKPFKEHPLHGLHRSTEYLYRLNGENTKDAHNVSSSAPMENNECCWPAEVLRKQMTDIKTDGMVEKQQESE